MESVLGRLEQVAIVISMFGHFLNNIRSLQIKANRKKHNVKISINAKADLLLACNFLEAFNLGLSMNSIVFRAPDHVYIGDSREHGLGGITVNHGASLRMEIPEELRGRAHINLL